MKAYLTRGWESGNSWGAEYWWKMPYDLESPQSLVALSFVIKKIWGSYIVKKCHAANWIVCSSPWKSLQLKLVSVPVIMWSCGIVPEYWKVHKYAEIIAKWKWQCSKRWTVKKQLLFDRCGKGCNYLLDGEAIIRAKLLSLPIGEPWHRGTNVFEKRSDNVAILKMSQEVCCDLWYYWPQTWVCSLLLSLPGCL